MTARRSSSLDSAALWVIEMLDEQSWKPTVAVGLSRQDAREACDRWRERNPDDKFRVREYRRVE